MKRVNPAMVFRGGKALPIDNTGELYTQIRPILVTSRFNTQVDFAQCEIYVKVPFKPLVVCIFNDFHS